MIKKDRLMPVIINGNLSAFITFYITNNEHEFDNADPFGIFDDNENGNLCYISQMITDLNPYNHNFSFYVMRSFREYIKRKFPNVKTIFWRRWYPEKFIVKIYKKGV